MKPKLTAKQQRDLVTMLMSLLAIGAVTVFWGAFVDRADRRAAEDAVERVAGDADVLWVVDIWRDRRGRRGPVTTLWCGRVDRIEGLVAVTTRTEEWPLSPFARVIEVAPEWVEMQTSKEALMLQDCVERLR